MDKNTGRRGPEAGIGPGMIIFLYGTALGAASFGLSWLLATRVFGHLYFLARLLPAAMVLYLLVAWLLYLRNDNFMASRDRAAERREKKRSSLAQAAQAAARPDPATTQEPTAGDGLSLFASFDEGIVPRQDDPGPRRQGRKRSADSGDEGEALSRRAQKILICAALELGIVSAFLYSVSGLGARYFL